MRYPPVNGKRGSEHSRDSCLDSRGLELQLAGGGWGRRGSSTSSETCGHVERDPLECLECPVSREIKDAFVSRELIIFLSDCTLLSLSASTYATRAGRAASAASASRRRRPRCRFRRGRLRVRLRDFGRQRDPVGVLSALELEHPRSRVAPRRARGGGRGGGTVGGGAVVGAVRCRRGG